MFLHYGIHVKILLKLSSKSERIRTYQFTRVKKILILIPTYNEAENVKNLYSGIKKLNIKSDILFVDDNSPDGTAEIITKIMRKDKSVDFLLRKKKEGIGGAHLAGIDWAYERGYSTLITMDCDFTHNPKDIPRLLKKGNGADIVVGSRYLSAGSLSDWNPIRKTLTRTAHLLTKLLLSIPYDATGAFRLYSLDKIPKQIFGMVESKGYSFFFESLFILSLNGFKIKEIPVTLPARTYGTSKMTIKDAWNSLIFLFQTYYLTKIYRNSYVYTPPFIKPKKIHEKGEDEWDEYWRSERKQRKILYDIVAMFYRKYIIKRNLNRYIIKYFNPKAQLLHAGCGGGQVDRDIANVVNITALDISTIALNIYKRQYKDSCKIIHGSILNIPTKSENYDGIYNLGVMEHFTKRDIKKILDEFHRVLKKNGKILLFWPPQFGLSVIFLNCMHFLLNNLLKREIRLHPHEITKVKSRKQIQTILKRSNFRLTSYDFGVRDLFTYAIIVGEKI